MKRKSVCAVVIFAVVSFAGCAKSKGTSEADPPIYIEENAVKSPPAPKDAKLEKFKRVYAKMTPRFRSEIKIAASDMQEFVSAVESLIENDTENLLTFCSKEKLLPSSYVPDDLVKLVSNNLYGVNRSDLSLRKTVEQALSVMATAALNERVWLAVSSSYRSYDYQVKLYERNVRELGKAAADRESARPGASQHQLGTVVDFGSVTDAYARTNAGKWLYNNAEDYGWSLSFPDGYEDVTGYRWECWHYRYVGKEACAVQKKFFNNVQHFMLEFIDAWKNG
ncbi:MAG: M15 family metallopeptidase [Treponema sp.]